MWAMPDQCLFCGHGRVTREHVIAQSLSRRLWEVSPFTPEHGAPIEAKPGATRFHTNRLIDMVVNVACNDCNSKFFNALQSPCDGFLRSALAGEHSTLVPISKRLSRAGSTRQPCSYLSP